MKNAKSTIAMRLAHRLQKQFKKASFKACLTYAWRIVNQSITVAQRILFGTMSVKLDKAETVFGVVYGLVIRAKGIKGLFSKPVYIRSKWHHFAKV